MINLKIRSVLKRNGGGLSLIRTGVCYFGGKGKDPVINQKYGLRHGMSPEQCCQ